MTGMAEKVLQADEQSLQHFLVELAVLVQLSEGWAAYTPDGRYKIGGNIKGEFWQVINLCRFEIGELDEFWPRLAADEPLW